MGSTLTKDPSTQQKTSEVCFSGDSQKLQNPLKTTSDNNLHNRVQITVAADENASHGEEASTQQSPSKALLCRERIGRSKTASDNSPRRPAESFETNQEVQASASHASDSERDEAAMRERGVAVARDASSTPEKDRGHRDKGRKRRKRQENPKAKRFRKEEEESAEEVASDCKRDDTGSRSSPAPLSPNSLSAKNVVRKKGEVVMAWTRDEDRAILIELKRKGASRDTFSGLSEKLNKPSEQIAHRFNQLMKLFKKQEKMDP